MGSALGPRPNPDFSNQVAASDAYDALATLVNANVDIIGSIAAGLSLLTGNQIMTAPGLAAGSTADLIAHGTTVFIIGGSAHVLTAAAAGVAWGGTESTVPKDTYGAFRLEVGADGTVDIVEAADNDTGYDSAALALAGLPAIQANHASLGTVTVTHTDAGGFVPDTTELGAEGVTAVFTDGTTLFESIVAALSA
jgi:hypothetical protein